MTMTVLKSKFAGHEEDKESGTVALFGYDFGGREHWENFSCYFLPDVVIGGLEMLSIAFLLLILYDYIPFNMLAYILVPFTLNFFLAYIASSSVHYRKEDSEKMFSYVSECLSRKTLLRLGIQLSLFGAKFAFIYMYSKNLSEAVSSVGSLQALVNISVDQPLDDIVLTDYKTMSIVCLWFMLIVESSFIKVEAGILIFLKSFVDVIPNVYAYLLSLIDMFGIFTFLLTHLKTERPNEVVYFSKIITTLPMLFMIVAAARCLVWFFIPWLFAKKEDRRCVYHLGMVHLCVAAANVISFIFADSRTLFNLKMMCFTTIAERFFMIGINVYLGYCKRRARPLRGNAGSSSDRPADASSSSSSSSSQRKLSAAGNANDEFRQPLLSHHAHQASQDSSSRPKISKVTQASVERQRILEDTLARKRSKRDSLKIKMQEKKEQWQAKRDNVKIIGTIVPALEVENSVPLEEELKALQAEGNGSKETARLILEKKKGIAELPADIKLKNSDKAINEKTEQQLFAEYKGLLVQVEILSAEIESLSDELETLSCQ